MEAVDRAEQLLDIEAIKQLKARYFRFLDLKAWKQWRTVFTDDCRFDRTSTVASGTDAFVAAVARNLEDIRSVHHGHMPEIVLTGPATATGVWAMHDLLLWSPDATVPDFLRAEPEQTGLAGYGHYEEEYRKDDGTWRISFMRLTRLVLVPLMDEHREMASVWPRASPDWLPGSAPAALRSL